MNTSVPRMTAAMNQAIASTRLQPNCVTIGATSAKMPMGANSNTQCTMRIKTSTTASAMFVSGARFSSGSVAAAMPKIVTNTMTGSKLPSAAALNGFVGTSCAMNCAPPGRLSAARWIAPTSAPAAARSATCCSGVTAACGTISAPIRKPSAIATSAVAQKNASVRATRRPTVRRSPSFAIPGRKTQYFNINAADEAKRNEVLGELAKQQLNVAVLLHSLAFGTLKPYIGDDALNKANIDMTLDVMAHSLVYWAQGVVKLGLMGKGGRIFSMTSSGSTRVFATYGAVSAAKAALESHTRQLALELAPHGIAVNALR